MQFTNAPATFAPPGPGCWELDNTHYSVAFTPFGIEAISEAFVRGFSEGTKRYGLLLDYLEPAFVNGFCYMRAQPVGAPPGAKGPPPKFVFKLLLRLHPEMRRRLRTARDAVETRSWLADMRYWDETFKPAAIRRYREFQQIDPSRLADDAAFAAHIEQCRALAIEGVYGHHRFTATACLPIGDFLAHAQEWTGESVPELLQLLRGYSPVSAGLAAPELDTLVGALREAGAENLLDGEPQAVQEALQQAAPPVAEAYAAYVDAIGQRIVTGYDISDRRAVEMPETVVRAIRAAVADTQGRESAERAREERTAAVRERVPERFRDVFDERLADARAVYRLRDERGVYNDAWATGLARRGVLAAGRYLADNGRLEAPELLIEASSAEMRALLLGQGGPSSDELARRHRERTATRIEEMPAYLGNAPSGPPPAEWLPPHAARLFRGIDIFMGALFKSGEAESSATVVRGIPVSPGQYEGRARRVLQASDFERIEQGDVLVTRTTSAYFNPLLPLLGAIVTDRGGSLSHAAIVAREYGIPGVVGTKAATETIPDGARVRVDGTTGEVTVLA